MANKSIFLLGLVLIFLYSCTANSEVTFGQGIKKLGEFDKSYGSTMKSAPNTTASIDELLTQITGFAASNKIQEPLRVLIDFRIKFLEAEKLNAEGWQWGKASTTEYGFGCKGYARIKESARLRNMSAQKGYEATNVLQRFVDSYPKEAESAALSQKDVLILKALYYQIQEKAEKDNYVIENFCGNKIKNMNLSEAKNAA